MAWAVPEYDRKEVDLAGRRIGKQKLPVGSPEVGDALAILNNWRSAHAYPLNTFQITLRNKSKKFEQEVIVAQRTKRLESIHAKLARQPSMRMSQMQDIAGCRAVLKDMSNVRKLVDLYKNSRFEHKLRSEKDYIENPKADGYRSHHLVFDYKGPREITAYDGLKIEVQVRTRLQHAWATAVEAVGIFTKQALKSNQGDEDWLRFFALMGSAIAAIERCNPIPNTPLNKQSLIDEIKLLSDSLHVGEMLMVYNTTIQAVGSAKDAKYFLLILDPDAAKITVRRYKAKESEKANRDYTKLESEIIENSATQVVLVSVENINALKRAYPNYFLDTNTFSDVVKQVLNGKFPDPII